MFRCSLSLSLSPQAKWIEKGGEEGSNTWWDSFSCKASYSKYPKGWYGCFLGIIIQWGCLVGRKLNDPHGDHVDEHAIITSY